MKIDKKHNKRKWLRCAGLYLCAMLFLCITGCSMEEATDEAVKTVAPKTTMESVQKEDSDIEEEENILGEDEGDSVLINKVDWTGYQEKLSTDDYQILQKYMPVLIENTEFIWIEQKADGRHKKRKVTLQNFLSVQSDDYYSKEKMRLLSITLCDVFQTGNKDLILHIENYGWEYIILHYDEEKLYAIDMSERCFQGLQCNGCYIGAGGYRNDYYCQMSFSNGDFSERTLAWQDENKYYMNNKKVSSKKFYQWRKEHYSNDVEYYVPVKK